MTSGVKGVGVKDLTKYLMEQVCLIDTLLLLQLVIFWNDTLLLCYLIDGRYRLPPKLPLRNF